MLNRWLLHPVFNVVGWTYTHFFRLEDSKDAIILLEDRSRLIGE